MAEEGSPVSVADWIAKVGDRRRGGDLKSALDLCAAGLQAHPNSTDLLFLYSEMNIDQFNRIKNADLLKAALIGFERLLKLNPRHYMANLLAARIYLKGKAIARAEEKLAAILKVTPADPRALELKTHIAKAKAQLKAAASKPAAVPAREKEPPPEEAKAEFGDEMVQTDGVEGLTSAAAEHEMLINRLSLFNRLEGVRSIHLIDPSGVEIKSIVKSGAGLDNHSSRITDIFRASGLCARKSGLGNFQRGTIMTPGAVVMLANVFYGMLVLLLDPGCDLKTAEARVVRYVEVLTE